MVEEEPTPKIRQYLVRAGAVEKAITEFEEEILHAFVGFLPFP